MEVTYWPQAYQLLLEIHDNRRTRWNEAMIIPMAETMAENFAGKVIIN